MGLKKRLERLEREARYLPHADQFEVVQAVPVAAARGKPPGLYRVGTPGSTAGVLVYDPALGRPVMPEGVLASCGCLIVCEPASFGPDFDPWD